MARMFHGGVLAPADLDSLATENLNIPPDYREQVSAYVKEMIEDIWDFGDWVKDECASSRGVLGRLLHMEVANHLLLEYTGRLQYALVHEEEELAEAVKEATDSLAAFVASLPDRRLWTPHVAGDPRQGGYTAREAYLRELSDPYYRLENSALDLASELQTYERLWPGDLHHMAIRVSYAMRELRYHIQKTWREF